MDIESISFSNELLNSYGFLMGIIFEKFNEMYELFLNEFGLKLKHAEILYVVNYNEGISQKHIGAAIKKDRTTIVKLIDDLERLELLVRKTDPSDRRYFNIYLTEKGKELHKKVLDIKATVENTLLDPLSDADKMQLKKILIKIL